MSIGAVSKIVATLKAATLVFGMVGAAIWAMDPTVKVGIISSIPATITGFSAFLLGMVNRKKITEVHLTMNSRLDELLRATKKQAHDEGRREGIASEQQRMRPADLDPPKKDGA